MNIFTPKQLWSFRAFIGGFFGFLLYLCVVVIYPWNPFELHSDVISVKNLDKKVIAGGRVHLSVESTKHWKGSTLVATELINHKRETLVPYWADREPGRKTIEKEVEIPINTAPGKYRLYRTFTTPITHFPKVNAVRDVWSEEFEVVSPEPQRGERGKDGPPGKEGKPGRNFWGNRR